MAKDFEGYVLGGLSLLVQLAPTEVLDVVLLECEYERQPELIRNIEEAGVSVVTTQAGWVREAHSYRAIELSIQDRLNLLYAKTHGRVLLAGDKPLRERCVTESVEVHGSLWLVEQALTRSLVPVEDLCRWLEVWPSIGRRLPVSEVRRLSKLLQCA